MRITRLALVLALVPLAFACRHRPPPPDPGPAATVTPPVEAPGTSERAPRAPLGGVWIEELEGGLGLVTVPLGATAPRPVMISLHGAESAAEWACGDWMAPTDGHAFIVCPRTATEKKGRLASWGSASEAAERSRRALELVRRKFGDWVANADPVLVGFSQGAEMAVVAADTHALPWSAVFVHEGGYRQAKTSLAHLLASDAGVFATCCTWSCGASLPRKHGALARTVDYGPHGHSLGPVYLRIRSDFADLVGDRPEWAGLPELKRKGHAAAGTERERGSR
jgi:hypothetical protein